MHVADAISANAAIPQGSLSINGGAIVLSSNGGLCGDLNAGKEPKGTQYLLLFVTNVNSTLAQTSAPTAAGTYTLFSGSGQAPSQLAVVSYTLTDASCNTIVASTATGTSGTVTLTSVGGGSYSGSFDVVLNTADHLTGNFNASNCSALSTLISQNANTTCI